jgi:hypothetical protein
MKGTAYLSPEGCGQLHSKDKVLFVDYNPYALILHTTLPFHIFSNFQ